MPAVLRSACDRYLGSAIVREGYFRVIFVPSGNKTTSVFAGAEYTVM